MKKFLSIFIVTLFVADLALAKEANVVFGGYSLGNDVSYGYLGGARALNGDLDKDGALLRVGGGYGKYE
jgi:hypothetical protein